MDDRKCRGPAKKTPLLTVVLLISVAMATGQIAGNDPKCLSTGGICAFANSCPEENVVIDSDGKPLLCGDPDANAVCCQSVPNNVESCHQNGGRCGDYEACRNVQKFGQMDCEEGTYCCLLIY